MLHDNLNLSNSQIGFSLGCFWQKSKPNEILKFLQEKGIKIVELKKITPIDQVEDDLAMYRKEDLEGFSFLSYHAPVLPYGKNKETEKFFSEIMLLHKLRPLDLLIVHPDSIQDSSIFNDLPFPIGFENMDKNKKSHRTVAEMEKLLAQNSSWKLVLDVNHCFVNDPSMQLAHDFYSTLGDRIAEIHLSGFAKLHDPLFETKQELIIKSIRDKNIPIIIESQMDLSQLLQERNYVLEVLKN
ncbi:MAG: hypothetical protein EXS46_01155 [Candidatus Taylorbacteria bacterium]|nr:hypothetical protein [Candidatus Taylorbacteria bacterium]